MAIAFHNIGVFGRLYTDVYEEVEPGPARALQAGGVNNFGVWLYSVLPQAGPRLLTFTLFRFEVNVRATAMVGFVGAGGIGDALHTAISLFQLADLGALLIIMLLVVTVVDSIGDRLRKRILVGSSNSERVNIKYLLNKLTGNKLQLPKNNSIPEIHQLQGGGFLYRVSSTENVVNGRVIKVINDTILVECEEQCPCSLVLDVFVIGTNCGHYEEASVLIIEHEIYSSPEARGVQHKCMMLELLSPSKAFMSALQIYAVSMGAEFKSNIFKNTALAEKAEA